MKTVITSNSSLLTILRSRSAIILIALTLMAFVLAQKTQALNPPPDGGYPGGNTAEGQAALLSLTTGGFNTAVGFFSLRSDTTSSFNTGVGAGTLLANTGDQNTATGAGALLSNTTGFGNTGDGTFALFSNTTGGTLGTAFGVDVGPNTAVGSQALKSNTITSANAAVGYQALGSYTTGFMNSDLGANTAMGFQALGNAIGGFANCGFGYRTLFSNADGGNNTAVGFNALLSNTSGNANTAAGAGALAFNTTGSSNTVIGVGAGQSVTTADRVICIGEGIAGDNVSDSCFIGGISSSVISQGMAVFVGSGNRLGTITSSERFKEDIKAMGKASDALFGLKPVTFRYKKEIDPGGTSQFGLVAEDVEKVNPDLVVRDKEGRPYTVRYEAVNAMLLNEFLKEHREVADLKSTVAEQRKGMEAMAAQLKAQGALIQKVSAQLEASRRAPQVVNNP